MTTEQRHNIDIIKKELGKEYRVRFIRFDDGNPVYNAFVPNAHTGFPIAIIFFNGKPEYFYDFLALDIINGLKVSKVNDQT